METAHIVCCNDRTEAVVLGDLTNALDIKIKLKKEHQKQYSPCKEYETIFFWHIHEDVPLYK